MLFRSDRKSTRLNSSHTIISYAVFCLKKRRSWGNSWRVGGVCGLWGGGGGVSTSGAPVLFLPTACPLTRTWLRNTVSVFFFFKGAPPPAIIPFSPPAFPPP